MRWTVTLIVLLSLLAPLLAAGICGNGICSSDKNCSTCSLDCGKCNGGSCSLDNECNSGICCNGACSSSCVTYPPKPVESPYIASVLAVGTYSAVLGFIFVIAIILILLARRKKA